MFVSIHREKKIAIIEKRTASVVPVSVELGDPHFEGLAQADELFLFAYSDSVDMGGHHGIDPEFDLAVECFQGKNVGDGADIFFVPEQDFAVAGNAEMIKLFHSRSVFRKQGSETPAVLQ